ncbi:MAG: hypothetical protein QOH06_2056 [Acidobacteriota bacterium]|jgi:hypothetical protein|nr:hypothetical protein [Acidobacteriota bacterium]
MANDWLYMNTVNGWDKVDAAVTAGGEPQLEVSLPALRTKSQRARRLFAQQASLTAAKQEITRELNQEILEGNALVDFIRTGARAIYGKDSEKLVEFGIKPFRGKSRRKKTPTPPLPEAPAPAPDSVK